MSSSIFSAAIASADADVEQERTDIGSDVGDVPVRHIRSNPRFDSTTMTSKWLL